MTADRIDDLHATVEMTADDNDQSIIYVEVPSAYAAEVDSIVEKHGFIIRDRSSDGIYVVLDPKFGQTEPGLEFDLADAIEDSTDLIVAVY